MESGKKIHFLWVDIVFFTKTVFKKSNEVKSIVFTINIGKKYDPFFYCFSQKNMSLFLSKIEVFILNTLLLPLSLSSVMCQKVFVVISQTRRREEDLVFHWHFFTSMITWSELLLLLLLFLLLFLLLMQLYLIIIFKICTWISSYFCTSEIFWRWKSHQNDV